MQEEPISHYDPLRASINFIIQRVHQLGCTVSKFSTFTLLKKWARYVIIYTSVELANPVGCVLQAFEVCSLKMLTIQHIPWQRSPNRCSLEVNLKQYLFPEGLCVIAPKGLDQTSEDEMQEGCNGMA